MQEICSNVFIFQQTLKKKISLYFQLSFFRKVSNPYKFLQLFSNFEYFNAKMKLKIQRKEKIGQIQNKSRAIRKIRKTSSLESLPTEVKFIVIQNLSSENKKNFRATSKLLRELVDDHQRHDFIKQTRFSSVEKYFPTKRFIRNSFAPPIVENIIKTFSEDNLSFIHQLEKENLLRSYFKQAKMNFSAAQMKVLFTLTMVDLVKCMKNGEESVNELLDDGQSCCLLLKFSITEVFFGVIWARQSMNKFTLKGDGTNFLLMLSRMLWIKDSLKANPNTNDVNMLLPMDFGTKLVAVGSRVKFNRPLKTTSELNCQLKIQASAPMIEALRSNFTNESAFNFHDSDDTLEVKALFTSKEARKSKFHQRTTFSQLF
jgi:hypothetical protein